MFERDWFDISIKSLLVIKIFLSQNSINKAKDFFIDHHNLFITYINGGKRNKKCDNRIYRFRNSRRYYKEIISIILICIF